MTTLPVVSRDSMIGYIADLLRATEAGSDDASCLADGVLSIARENPEVLHAVNVFMTCESMSERQAALIGMVITYGVLKTQAEQADLERMVSL